MKKSVLVSDKTLSASFSESYRTIYTNIHYSFHENPTKLLLITSSIPKEGKTTTAVNLALTMAEDGKKVLLVDTDLRVPSIYKIFGHDRNKGLTNILIDMYNTDPAEGDLSQFGLGDLFHILHIQGRSGLLSIAENGDPYHLWFQNGRLVDVQWENRPEEERIGNILVQSGKITSDQKTNALRRQAHTTERLGAILTNMNLVSPKDVEGPLKLHMAGALFHIASLKQASFCFQDQKASEIHFPFSSNGDNPLHNIQKQYQESDDIPFIDQKIASYLQDGPLENLKVLNTGPIPSNPTELLNSKRMHELMHILKKRFDIIIFDSPPVGSVTDACILAARVDGVILVVRVGQSNRKMAQKVKQQLETVGAKISGVILNRLDMKKDAYYYHGYYRYYRYGYYHKQKEPDPQ